MNDMMKNLQRMTSLEIAQVTGKMHKDVMKAIRNMEPAWEQERGRKFALTQLRVDIPNGGYRLRPVYILTKTECLYVATKFNDAARARLVLRWEELEHARLTQATAPQGNHDREAISTQKFLLYNREAISVKTIVKRLAYTCVREPFFVPLQYHSEEW